LFCVQKRKGVLWSAQNSERKGGFTEVVKSRRRRGGQRGEAPTTEKGPDDTDEQNVEETESVSGDDGRKVTWLVFLKSKGGGGKA